MPRRAFQSIHNELLRVTNSSRKEKREARLVDVGDVAPDFELVDHKGTKHKLSSFRGRRVLLSFYRYAA